MSSTGRLTTESQHGLVLYALQPEIGMLLLEFEGVWRRVQTSIYAANTRQVSRRLIMHGQRVRKMIGPRQKL